MESLLLIAALLTACLAATLAAMVAHGALRPLLEARGVRPWRVRDTLAAIPLVIVGSAGAGASGSVLVAAIAGALRGANSVAPWAAAGALLLGGASCVVLLLGVLALRKLS